eukprot:763886-Alexandrium_andersonii.AAC.1
MNVCLHEVVLSGSPDGANLCRHELVSSGRSDDSSRCHHGARARANSGAWATRTLVFTKSCHPEPGRRELVS